MADASVQLGTLSFLIHELPQAATVGACVAPPLRSGHLMRVECACVLVWAKPSSERCEAKTNELKRCSWAKRALFFLVRFGSRLLSARLERKPTPAPPTPSFIG